MPRPRNPKPNPHRKTPKKPATQAQLDMIDRLDAVQKELGLNRDKLAEEIGVSPSTLGNWLNAENLPNREAMIRLCKISGVSLDWLYLGTIDRLTIAQSIRLTARIKGMDPETATIEVLSMPGKLDPEMVPSKPPKKRRKPPKSG